MLSIAVKAPLSRRKCAVGCALNITSVGDWGKDGGKLQFWTLCVVWLVVELKLKT
jgi:hypothetical protein